MRNYTNDEVRTSISAVMEERLAPLRSTGASVSEVNAALADVHPVHARRADESLQSWEARMNELPDPHAPYPGCLQSRW